jgi:hypothetical protein
VRRKQLEILGFEKEFKVLALIELVVRSTQDRRQVILAFIGVLVRTLTRLCSMSWWGGI